jgi:hypothetical protein
MVNSGQALQGCDEMMKTETVEFPIKSAFASGEWEDKSLWLKGSFQFTGYDNKAEIKEEHLLDADAYVSAVNAKLKAKERAKATTAALEVAAKAFKAANPNAVINPYERPDQNTPEVIRENMIKSTMKLHKVSREVAEKIQAMSEETARALATV